MSVVDLIRELGWPLPSHPEGLEEKEFDPHTGEGAFHLYETDACNFDVLDGGAWYMIDTEHLHSDLYAETDVPESVLARARVVIWPMYKSGKWDWREDPTPIYLDALRKEFDDARFVNMTIIPGAIY